MVRYLVLQPENRRHVDNLHVRPEIIDHDGRRRRGGRRRFESSLELGEVAGEGERGAEEEGVGLDGPGREGGDEAGGLERVVLVVFEVGREVGGDEAERVVLGAEVEEVVRLGLTLLDDVAAGGALRYRPA